MIPRRVTMIKKALLMMVVSTLQRVLPLLFMISIILSLIYELRLFNYIILSTILSSQVSTDERSTKKISIIQSDLYLSVFQNHKIPHFEPWPFLNKFVCLHRMDNNKFSATC